MMTGMSSVDAPPDTPAHAPPSAASDPEAWLTIDQAAKEAGFARRTIERALAAFRQNPATGLPHTKPSGRLRGSTRIRRRWLTRWMNGLSPDPEEFPVKSGRSGRKTTGRKTSGAMPPRRRQAA